jgi:hypothetical protein
MAWTAHRTGAQVMAVIGETTGPAIDGAAPLNSSSSHDSGSDKAPFISTRPSIPGSERTIPWRRGKGWIMRWKA